MEHAVRPVTPCRSAARDGVPRAGAVDTVGGSSIRSLPSGTPSRRQRHPVAPTGVAQQRRAGASGQDVSSGSGSATPCRPATPVPPTPATSSRPATPGRHLSPARSGAQIPSAGAAQSAPEGGSSELQPPRSAPWVPVGRPVTPVTCSRTLSGNATLAMGPQTSQKRVVRVNSGASQDRDVGVQQADGVKEIQSRLLAHTVASRARRKSSGQSIVGGTRATVAPTNSKASLSSLTAAAAVPRPRRLSHSDPNQKGVCTPAAQSRQCRSWTGTTGHTARRGLVMPAAHLKVRRPRHSMGEVRRLRGTPEFDLEGCFDAMWERQQCPKWAKGPNKGDGQASGEALEVLAGDTQEHVVELAADPVVHTAVPDADAVAEAEADRAPREAPADGTFQRTSEPSLDRENSASGAELSAGCSPIENSHVGTREELVSRCISHFPRPDESVTAHFPVVPCPNRSPTAERCRGHSSDDVFVRPRPQIQDGVRAGKASDVALLKLLGTHLNGASLRGEGLHRPP
mmetsp:Transcript_64287/g.139901  ORF Transcript_64287/g.139901 Transcript_64287/m.139901 type:complete len:514 (+) Transcript_64287:60-1601(+)